MAISQWLQHDQTFSLQRETTMHMHLPILMSMMAHSNTHILENGILLVLVELCVSLVPKAPTLWNTNIEVVQAWRAWYFFSREQRLG